MLTHKYLKRTPGNLSGVNFKTHFPSTRVLKKLAPLHGILGLTQILESRKKNKRINKLGQHPTGLEANVSDAHLS